MAANLVSAPATAPLCKASTIISWSKKSKKGRLVALDLSSSRSVVFMLSSTARRLYWFQRLAQRLQTIRVPIDASRDLWTRYLIDCRNLWQGVGCASLL